MILIDTSCALSQQSLEHKYSLEMNSPTHTCMCIYILYMYIFICLFDATALKNRRGNDLICSHTYTFDFFVCNEEEEEEKKHTQTRKKNE